MRRSPLRRAAVVALTGAAGALAGALPAAAGISPAYLIVTTTADSHDVDPGDRRCADALGECSLRAAFEEADAQINEDTVDLPPGRYVLDPALGPLTHRHGGPLLLQGGGDGSSGPSVVDGGGQVGPLVDLDLVSAGSVRLRQVTLTGSNGSAVDATSTSGSSLHLEFATVAGNVQGVRSSATTTVTSSRIEGNGSVRDREHPTGGIEIDGADLLVRNSAVFGNAGTVAGAILVQGDGELDLVGSTVTGNQVPTSSASEAVVVGADASARLRFATVVDDARAIGSLGTTTVESSVVVGACTGDVHGLGASVVTDAACLGEPSSSDVVAADPGLAPFDQTGDPFLPVHPLREGSPAIDRDDDCVAGGELFTADLRDHPRPDGSACDAGASEGFLAEVPGTSATQDVVVEVVGELSIAVTQGAVSFEPLRGGATAVAAVGGLVATNTLTSGPSWNVTVSATALSNGVDTVGSGAMTFAPGATVTAGPEALGAPVPGPAGTFDGSLPWSAALTVLQGDGSVRGTFTLDGSTLAITTPPVTPSGTYAGTLQYTILG